MNDSPLLQDIAFNLRTLFGSNCRINHLIPLGGGSINMAGKLNTALGNFFLKWNHSKAASGMFEAEAKGLKLLSGKGLFVPRPLARGSINNQSWLLIEWIDQAPGEKNFWENFGQGLALLHQHRQAKSGLDHSNYIGSLIQNNHPQGLWPDFYIRYRLQPQLDLANENGLIPEKVMHSFEQLFKKIPDLFPKEKASLLHGDLWSGNFLNGPAGQAAVFDPAVYYGHREMDLAMSRLFGGFDPAFYKAYHETYPLSSEYENRIGICQLYPLLVHVNLFGTSYLHSINQILKAFL